jgi:hypothetical protein
MNALLKFIENATVKLTEEHIILSTTILRSKMFAEYKDKLVLIDGVSKDDIGLAQSYGFKYFITLAELLSLYPSISTLTMLDFFG